MWFCRCLATSMDSFGLIDPAVMISWQLLRSVPATFIRLASELTRLTSRFPLPQRRWAARRLCRGSDIRLQTLTVRGRRCTGAQNTPQPYPKGAPSKEEGELADAWLVGRSALQRRCTAEGDTGLNGGRVPNVWQLWSGKWTGQGPHEWKSELQVTFSIIPLC